MINYREEQTIRKLYDSITCDMCNKTYDTITEMQEFLSYENTGGYTSVFGDGTRVTLDICQYCQKEKLPMKVHDEE